MSGPEQPSEDRVPVELADQIASAKDEVRGWYDELAGVEGARVFGEASPYEIEILERLIGPRSGEDTYEPHLKLCPHLISPQPVGVHATRPRFGMCRDCFNDYMDWLAEIRYPTRCDFCGERAEPSQTLVLNVGFVMVFGLACDACVERLRAGGPTND